jgi:hypothetical protein
MIKITFFLRKFPKGELLSFEVEDKNVYYTDKHFKRIQILPKNAELLSMRISFMRGRNKYPEFLQRLFTLKAEDEKQYNEAKDEKELANIIIFDGKLMGLKLMNVEMK